MKAEHLIKRYRPDMTAGVLHIWARTAIKTMQAQGQMRDTLEWIKEHLEAGVCVDDETMLQRIDAALSETKVRA